MPRVLSTALRSATLAQNTDEAVIMLLRIDHASLGNFAYRLCGDLVPLVSRGETYVPFPFELALPDDVEERPPRAQLTVDNVSREIVRFVRNLPSGTPPTVEIELVRALAPNTVEATWGPFTLSEPSYDALTVSGELMADDRSQEPFPEGRYTPNFFPALFVRA